MCVCFGEWTGPRPKQKGPSIVSQSGPHCACRVNHDGIYRHTHRTHTCARARAEKKKHVQLGHGNRSGIGLRVGPERGPGQLEVDDAIVWDGKMKQRRNGGREGGREEAGEVNLLQLPRLACA